MANMEPAVVPREDMMDETSEYLRLDVRSLKNVFQSRSAAGIVDGSAAVAVCSGAVDVDVEACRHREGVKKEGGIVGGLLELRIESEGFLLRDIEGCESFKARDDSWRRVDGLRKKCAAWKPGEKVEVMSFPSEARGCRATRIVAVRGDALCSVG